MLASDYSLFGEAMSDPYCEVLVGAAVEKERKRTRHITNTLNPVWDEEFVVDVHRPYSTLTIKVYDYDRYSKDDHIGGSASLFSSFLHCAVCDECGGFVASTSWHPWCTGEAHVPLELLRSQTMHDVWLQLHAEDGLATDENRGYVHVRMKCVSLKPTGSTRAQDCLTVFVHVIVCIVSVLLRVFIRFHFVRALFTCMVGVF